MSENDPYFGIKLIKRIRGNRSTHPDERMSWLLEDMAQFVPPSLIKFSDDSQPVKQPNSKEEP